MSSKAKKLCDKINLDESLSSEGIDNEQSLADDTDALNLAFSGHLSFEENGERKTSTAAPGVHQGSFTRSDTGSLSMSADELVSETTPRGQLAFEIIAANIVKEGRSKHVAYSIAIVRGQTFDSLQAIVVKRYSDFEKLNQKLKKKFPGLMETVAFPKKLITGNFDEKNIAHRSRTFEQYVTHIHSLEEIRYSSEFQQFFYSDELVKAHGLIRNGDYSDSVPLLKNAVNIQRKILGDAHRDVIGSYCALIVALTYQDPPELQEAQNYADVVLRLIGDDYGNRFLIALLQTNITLCWKLGKDKKDLEQRVIELEKKGLDCSSLSPDALLHMVVKKWK